MPISVYKKHYLPINNLICSQSELWFSVIVNFVSPKIVRFLKSDARPIDEPCAVATKRVRRAALYLTDRDIPSSATFKRLNPKNEKKEKIKNTKEIYDYELWALIEHAGTSIFVYV